MRIKINEITPYRIYEAALRRLTNIPNNINWMLSDFGIKNREKIRKYHNKHKNDRCFIIANGPSLKETNVKSLKNEITFSMNRAYLLFDDWGFTPTYHVCINELVLEQFSTDLEKLATTKFYNWNRHKNFNTISNDLIFLNLDLNLKDYFSIDASEKLCSGGTVTYACLQLAYYMGFKEVIIIGMDHSFKEKGRANKLETRIQEVDESHCHPDYFPKGIKWQLPDLLRSEIAYQLARKTFERESKSIIDATTNGQCHVFTKSTLQDIFNKS